MNGSTYHYTVLASDVTGVASIVEGSEALVASHPAVRTELSEVKTSQRYCVIRIWATKRVGDELPVFIITEKAPMLDSVTFCHRAEKDCADWAGEQRAIYELHCYAVPDSLRMNTKQKTLMKDFSLLPPRAMTLWTPTFSSTAISRPFCGTTFYSTGNDQCPSPDLRR